MLKDIHYDLFLHIIPQKIWVVNHTAGFIKCTIEMKQNKNCKKPVENPAEK